MGIESEQMIGGMNRLLTGPAVSAPTADADGTKS